MTTAKHTPGPWHVNAIDSMHGRITGDETSEGWDKLQINGANRTIASVYRSKDARLIAAAPALLAALERVDRAFERGRYPELQGIWTDAINAIRKAKGEK